MFIVFPDAANQVKGIDQMFGDSTLGPDGKYSKNGYQALAKWDGMELDGVTRSSDADGYITTDDPIFAKLRLWSDQNLDAIATGDELFTLAEMQIEVIDLHYDGSYIEMDRYGNFTTYKSVVKDASGRLHLLFDLWFNVHEN